MTKKEISDKRTDPVRNEYDTLAYEDKDKASTLIACGRQTFLLAHRR